MRTLTQLEKQGYLLRSTSPYDKRIRLLTLTAEGRTILEKLNRVIETYQRRVTEPSRCGSRHLQRHVKSNRLQLEDNPRRR